MHAAHVKNLKIKTKSWKEYESTKLWAFKLHKGTVFWYIQGIAISRGSVTTKLVLTSEQELVEVSQSWHKLPPS